MKKIALPVTTLKNFIVLLLLRHSKICKSNAVTRPKFIGSQVEGDMRSIQEHWRVTLRSAMMPTFLTLFYIQPSFNISTI